VVVGVVGWWFAKHHLPRFLLPVMALACAPVALLLDAVPKRPRVARVALVVVAVVAIAGSAAETMRVVFRGDDITWSHMGGADRAEFYAMPEFVYELPPGTKVLLLAPTEEDYHQTFRYPLVGELPGNDVVMEGDVGVLLDRRSPESVRRSMAGAGIEYVFLRTIGLKQFTTLFDSYPESFPKVYDDRRPSYPWYRESFAFTPSGEYLGPGMVITKIHAVAPN